MVDSTPDGKEPGLASKIIKIETFGVGTGVGDGVGVGVVGGGSISHIAVNVISL